MSDAAMRERVIIAKNFRDRTAQTPTDFFETVVKGRLACRVEDLDEATIKAIEEAEVPARFAHLDDEPGR
jgi:hypothetical protein